MQGVEEILSLLGMYLPSSIAFENFGSHKKFAKKSDDVRRYHVQNGKHIENTLAAEK